MAPTNEAAPSQRAFDLSTSSDQFRAQWSQPSDIFTILLILGGDVVHIALAQLAGPRLAPVAFSFGWVAYSISALVLALGSKRLMPSKTDCTCKVINGRNGFVRENSSWVISRIVRDLEAWTSVETHQRQLQNINAAWIKLKKKSRQALKPSRAGLVVSVYAPSKTVQPATQRCDLLHWSGSITIVLQLGLAAVPLGLYGDWSILAIDAAGTLLALGAGLLPQWHREKWACRRNSPTPYILTQGNGSQHALLILGNGHGLNLEDLATGQTDTTKGESNYTRFIISSLALLWIVLLISATGIQDHSWYLIGVGALGSLQNILVAGAVRNPAAHGIPLDFVRVFGSASVMRTLFAVEEAYPGIGTYLRNEFFPGALRESEAQRWRVLEARAVELQHRQEEEAENISLEAEDSS